MSILERSIFQSSGAAGPRFRIVGRASTSEKLTHFGDDSSLSCLPLLANRDRGAKGWFASRSFVDPKEGTLLRHAGFGSFFGEGVSSLLIVHVVHSGWCREGKITRRRALDGCCDGKLHRLTITCLISGSVPVDALFLTGLHFGGNSVQCFVRPRTQIEHFLESTKNMKQDCDKSKGFAFFIALSFRTVSGSKGFFLGDGVRMS